jgi:hypothetical protein
MRLLRCPDFTGFPPPPEIKECMAGIGPVPGNGNAEFWSECAVLVDIPILEKDKDEAGN